MDQNNASQSSLPAIKKLPPFIINKIAAGEVIQYPASMAKELMENSLDAGATRITIKVQNGGLEKFIISDNGHGIRAEDLPLVCERHTTSKLQSLDDLTRIGTFGFRGEALASVSCVAQVRITSKTHSQQCAYRALFMNNKIFPDGDKPTPIAASNGTTIEVERLFHDNQIRFQAQKHSQELKRLVDCLKKYALHNHGIQFTVKKIVSNKKDEMLFSTSTNTNFKKNLRILYGRDAAKAIMSTQIKSDSLKFECTAQFTNPKYCSSHSQFIIFINNRLVKCAKLKRDIEALFESYLPHRKKPFVYLSLTLDPATVDVNCHPAKEQVGFINEDEIIETIREGIKEKLVGSDDARVLYAQQALPYTSLVSGTAPSGGARAVDLEAQSSLIDIGPSSSQSTNQFGTDAGVNLNQTRTKQYDYNKVRSTTADQVGDMEKYLTTNASSSKRPVQALSQHSSVEPEKKRRRTDDSSAIQEQASPQPSDHAGAGNSDDEDNPMEAVLCLLESVSDGSPAELQKVISEHVYVGWVTPRMILFQHETTLFSIDPVALSRTLFYQVILRRFRQLGRMRFEKPISMRKILGAIMGDEQRKECVEILKWGYVAELLSSYFSLDLDISPEDDVLLTALPIVLKNYIPPMHRLPTLIYQLAMEVNWREEKACYHDISTYLAEFYELCHEHEVIPEDPNLGDSQYENDTTPSQMEQSTPLHDTVLKKGYTHAALKWVTQHVIFDTARKSLLYTPPSNLPETANITKVTQLNLLYKHFERC